MAYIGQSLVEGTRRVYNYTATASQTTFHAVYQVGVVDVYKNGLLLAPDTYTATDGANIVLDTGASAGDTIAIHCHNTFSVTDTVPASGGSFTGDVTMQGNLNVQGTTTTLDSASAQTVDLGDNDKIRLGDGNDLEIYHDGSHSYIKELGGGNLSIMSDGAGILMEKTDGENIAFFDTVNSNVELFESGTKRLETTSTGVDVTGTVTADGLTVDGNATISSSSPTLVLEDTDGAAQDDARLQVGASIFNIKRDSDNLTRLTVGLSTGDISFYEDTGTTAKFFWDASAERLGIGTTNPSTPLVISNNGAEGIEFQAYNTTLAASLMQAYNRSTSSFIPLEIRTTELEVNNGSGTTYFKINTNGNIGVNTSGTPSAKIDIRVPASASYENALNLSNGSNADIQFKIQNSLSIITPSTSTPLAFGVGGTEKVRLNANGSLTLKQQSGVGALQINSGDSTSQSLGNAQIAMGYNGVQNYQHYIATRHNSSTDENNSIDFYISQGNQNTAFPSDTRHVLRLDGRGIVQTPAQIGFSAKSNISSYSVSSDTQTITSFADTGGVPGFNRGGHYDTSTCVFTAPVAGLYHFTAAARWETGTFVQNSYIRWFLSKNNGNFNSANSAQINGSNEAWGAYMAQFCSATVYLAANDTMRVKGGMNGGTAKLHSESYFTGVLLG